MRDSPLRNDEPAQVMVGIIKNEVMLEQVRLETQFKFAHAADKKARRTTWWSGFAVGWTVAFVVMTLVAMLT